MKQVLMDVLIKYNYRRKWIYIYIYIYIYIKKDHITIQSFNLCSFLKTIIWLAQAMMSKCMELLRDTMDWKMIEAKKFAKTLLRKKRRKKENNSSFTILKSWWRFTKTKMKNFNFDFPLEKFITFGLLFFNFLHTVIFISIIYSHIYSHPQTDCFVVSQLFSVARHTGHLKLGSKPAQLYIRLSIILFSQQVNHSSSGIIRH